MGKKITMTNKCIKILQILIMRECIIELGPLMAPLNDAYGVGVRQHLALARKRGDKQETVGRFTCILKIVVLFFALSTYLGRLYDKVRVF